MIVKPFGRYVTKRLHGLLVGDPEPVHSGGFHNLQVPIPVCVLAAPHKAWSWKATAQQIHVTVLADRRVRKQPGIRIHYGKRLTQARHPTRIPAVTRVDDTVLDLVDAAEQLDEVVGWPTRACQRRLTTPERLIRALEQRRRFSWRSTVTAMLGEVSDGAESALEIAYVRKVERAQGLPPGSRQQHWRTTNRSRWNDVEYADYGVIVELDGRVGHVADGAFRDRRRDNISTVLGRVTLRYGWSDTLDDSCGTAAEVAQVLRGRGWAGRPRRCGPGCLLADAA